MKGLIIAAMCMLLCLGGVMAVDPVSQDQTVNVTIGEMISFTVDPLNYPTAMPGASTGADSVITVAANNNVPLTFNIGVHDVSDSNDLFWNIIFDIDGNNAFNEDYIGLGNYTLLVADSQTTAFTKTIKTKLDVPTGFAPGTYDTGKISYIAMKSS